MKLSVDDMARIAAESKMALRTFKKNYLVAHCGKKGICLFQTTYSYTDHARRPDDGKLREIKFDLNWLSVDGQHILPKPGVWKYPPLSINMIYS
jgi:hypothetical protein